MFDSESGRILERIMEGNRAPGNFLTEELVRIGFEPAVLISAKMTEQCGRCEKEGKKQNRNNYRTFFSHI